MTEETLEAAKQRIAALEKENEELKNAIWPYAGEGGVTSITKSKKNP